MTLPTLGVDPGSQSGAAALLDGTTITGWLSWEWLRGKGGRYRVKAVGCGEMPEEVAHLSEIGRALSGLSPYRLVVEGLFLAAGNSKASKGKRRSLLPLAESAGELVGTLRYGSVGEVLRPLAQSDWRPTVLGLPRDTGEKEAEERAVWWARRHLVWAAPLPKRGLTYVEEGAVCEAACMAVWGAWQDAASVEVAS